MFDIIRKLDMRYPNGDTSKRKVRFLECYCHACNRLFEIRSDNVKGRKTCGCIGNKGVVNIGERFSRLVVVEDLGIIDKNNTGNRQRYVKCKCDCNNIIDVIYNSLKTGNTNSCGCYKSEVASDNMSKNRLDTTVHGMYNSKIYGIWKSMRQRCTNINNEYFHRYGGRGISVCSEWNNSFLIFYDWAINNGYEEGLSIDRLDNDGNYEPSNCQWMTMSKHAVKTAVDRRGLS